MYYSQQIHAHISNSESLALNSFQILDSSNSWLIKFQKAFEMGCFDSILNERKATF